MKITPLPDSYKSTGMEFTLSDDTNRTYHSECFSNDIPRNHIPNSLIKSLKCWYTNADSLINKLDELRCKMKVTSPDILCVTEVYPKNCVYDIYPALLQINGYDCFISSFSHNSRGVCIYVRSSLHAHILNVPDINFNESLWCSEKVSDSDTLVVGVIYRSPSSSPENDSRLLRLLQEIQNLADLHLLITGDFNLPLIDWNLWTTPERDLAGNSFLDTLNDLFMFQHVSFPTRVHEGQISSTLDLVLTNDENNVDFILTLDPLGKSDHILMEFDYICSVSLVETVAVKYQYEFGNYQEVCADLEATNWNDLFADLSVENMWACFYSRFKILLDKYIPVSSTAPGSSKPPWLTKLVLKKIKQKRKAWFKYRSTCLQKHYLEYAKCRNVATETVRKAKQSYKQNLVQNFDINPKNFWKYVRSKTKVKCSLGNLLRSDGSLSANDNETADILNTFLAVFYQGISNNGYYTIICFQEYYKQIKQH